MAELAQEELLILQKSFFKERGLVKQHLDSYNDFIDHGIQQIIDETGEIRIEIPESPYKIKLGQASKWATVSR